MAPVEHPDPNRLWKHRRTHSYLALCGLFALTGGLLAGWVDKDAVPLAQTLAWAFLAVVVAYICNCAFEAFVANKWPK